MPMPEDVCRTCNGARRITRTRKDGSTYREDCPACGGCGSRHAGVTRQELDRDNYHNEPRKKPLK